MSSRAEAKTAARAAREAAQRDAAASSPAVQHELRQAAAAAKAAGVNSTPTFLLNGKSCDASNVEQALRNATS